MRRAELLVTQVQRATENERVGSADGISLEEYYQYFTDGARFLQRLILDVNDKAFRKAETWSADGAENRDLPADYFARNKVATLEYSSTGNVQDYRVLKKVTQLERYSITGNPDQYILEGKALKINAYPSSGTFRLTYAGAMPTVDKRRATVGAATTAGGALTVLTLAGFTAADYALSDHLTIVDFNGTIKMRGIPYTSVNSGSGAVAIQGTTYTYPTGSTIAVGDYVCLGAYASTHILFDDATEDFFLLYSKERILMRDSSGDAVAMNVKVLGVAQAIADTYSDDSDVDQIPITNSDYFNDF